MDKSRLIAALRSSAEALRGGCEYEWVESEKCNCGILAEQLLGHQVCCGTMWKVAYDRRERTTCSITGLPMVTVFDTLKKAGLGIRALKHLEHLSDQAVRDRASLPLITMQCEADFDEREAVILYMEAWADILQEERDVQELLKVQGVPDAEPSVATVAGSRPSDPASQAAPIANATLA